METEHANADSLIERIESLERQNRRMKRGGLFSILLIFILLFSGWNSLKEYPKYHGSNFTLRDKFGDSRATLTYDPQNYKGKLMFGRVEKRANDENVVTWNTRIWLGQDGNENPKLEFRDSNGVVRLALGIKGGVLWGGEEPYMEFFESDGTSAASYTMRNIDLSNIPAPSTEGGFNPGQADIQIHGFNGSYISIDTNGVTVGQKYGIYDDDGNMEDIEWRPLKEWTLKPTR
jgi:hypothetical protein